MKMKIVGGCAALVVLWFARDAQAFSAQLQGQSFGSTNWQSVNLMGWKELDFAPCRTLFTGGPATNQTIVVTFDHTQTAGGNVTPGIENLYYFTNSSNVTITSGPTLSAPLGVDQWSYTFTVTLTSATNAGFVQFYARLAAGCHNFSGSSLHLGGTPALSTLQIAKPGPAPGSPDLGITKMGPATANPGEVITYVLSYTNQATAGGATGVQLSDTLPSALTFVSCSAGCSVVGPTIIWDLGSVARGVTGSVTYQAQVINSAINGSTFQNSAFIAEAENDVNPADNRASVVTTVTFGCIPPSIVTAPAGATNCAGAPVSLSVSANGTALAYQWRKNTAPIPGATNATYSVSSLAVTDGGTYDVVLTNLCGTATSAGTTVVVTSTTADALISQTNCPGDSVSFSTTAHGVGPFSYQWVKDGVLLSGQTNSSLALSGITNGSTGVYSVQVNGACNSITNFANLTVNTPTTADALLSQTNCPGDAVSFNTTAHGTGPFSYQWAKDGSPLSGQINSTLTLSGISGGSTGVYSVQVSGACNSVTNFATLTVNTPTTADALFSQTNCPGGTVSFSAAAHGTGPFSYQWVKDGSPLSSQTNSTLTLSGITSGSAGLYSVQIIGACNSVTNFATLTVNTPTTADALLSQTNCPGDTVSFSTTAHGTGPFSYQWIKDSLALSGKTDSSLTLIGITSGSAGLYSVQVSGACNSVTNFANLTVNTPTTADALLSQTNCPGDTVSFSTTAHGTGPFSYQWVRDGSPLSGKTDSSLTLISISSGSAGLYSVQVSGACNSVTNFANLTVNTPTTADALTSQTNCPGDTVLFSTTAHGTGPFSYQWVKDGSPLSGKTDSTLTLSSISSGSAGLYSVQVSGACNSVTNFANLTVNTPTTADALISRTNCPGDTVSFSTTAHGTGPFSYQWVKDGSPLSGKTDNSLTLSGISSGSAGLYSVQVSGACNSVTNFANLTVNTPTTGDALTSRTNCPWDTVSFSTTAHGTGPFSYQWVKDGSPLSGKTDSTLTLSSISSGSAGLYSVQVSGACNSVTNFANLTVNTPTTADALISRTNCPGDAVSFSTTAHGTGPFSYQWVKDGSALSGKTDSSLTLIGITSGSAGLYLVQVSGACNSVTNFANLTVNTPTTADALTSRTNCPGDTVSFSTTAHGTGPFSYQWVKDGSALSSKTDSSLALSAISSGSAGLYSVQVSGACNSVTNFANLTVNTPTTADALISRTNCPGDSVSFSTTAHGTGPFSYQWVKDGSPLSGKTDNSLTLSGISSGSAGVYSVQVSGACNSVTNFANLTVNTPTTADALISRTNCPGDGVSFSTTAHGTGPFSYQWVKDGSPLSGKTDNSLTLSGISSGSAGVYSVQVSGACNSVTNFANLTVNTPTTADALTSRTNCPGDTVSFSTTAHGTGPFSYQWVKDGSPLSGKTDSSLALSGISSGSAGLYSVQVSGACNSVTNLANLTVNTPTTADALTSRTNCPGDTVSFSTTAHGTGPFSYQWVKDGSPLSGKTDNSLTLSGINSGSAGLYSVQVSGACNSVTNFANLAVNTPTTADALISRTNCPGDTVSFNTTAHGTGPFNYQWVKNGQPLSGKTDINLTLSGISSGSAGTYSVQVSGACNSVTNLATLTVNTPTTADALLSQTNCPGDTVSFSTTAHGTGPFSYQWAKNGQSLSGKTDSNLTLSGISSGSAGTYSVQVSGACNSVTNSATLTVNTPTTADALVSQTNCPGDTATFSTTAHGTGPFSYMWYKDTKPLAGATSSMLVLSVTPVAADAYSVCVRGACNSVTNSAILAVNRPTTATALTNQTACFGQNATFCTVAAGTGPFTYAWTKNGHLLTGRTSASLVLSNVAGSDAGTYSVAVAGACNSVTNSATLSIQNDGLASPATFANVSPIAIPDSGTASPYPSTIQVTCVPGSLSLVTVTVSNLSHTYASDLSLLLAGPNGQAVMLMSDAGQGTVISNGTLTFSDAAQIPVPLVGPIPSGTYKPTDYDLNDVLPPSAPARPYATSLSAFVGSSPNGTWSLFVLDDQPGDSGSIAGGWCLSMAWQGSGGSSPVTPWLSDAVLRPDGHFQATLHGQANGVYVIQATDDFLHWTPIQTNSLSGQTWDFVDPATASSTRFYRAMVMQ